MQFDTCRTTEGHRAGEAEFGSEHHSPVSLVTFLPGTCQFLPGRPSTGPEPPLGRKRRRHRQGHLCKHPSGTHAAQTGHDGGEPSQRAAESWSALGKFAGERQLVTTNADRKCQTTEEHDDGGLHSVDLRRHREVSPPLGLRNRSSFGFRTSILGRLPDLGFRCSRPRQCRRRRLACLHPEENQERGLRTFRSRPAEIRGGRGSRTSSPRHRGDGTAQRNLHAHRAWQTSISEGSLAVVLGAGEDGRDHGRQDVSWIEKKVG